MIPTDDSDTWTGLTNEPISVDEISKWVMSPSCGAIVTFNGTARDHSKGRPEVSFLKYEAYVEQVDPRLRSIVEEARVRWPDLERIAMIHRIGSVEIGESAVVISVSAPHRSSAFLAAQFCIDTLKGTVPIWKSETWDGGQSWGLDPQHVQSVESSAMEQQVR